MVKFDLLCSCQTKTDLGCYQTHPSVMLTGPDKTLEIAGRFPRSPTPSHPPPDASNCEAKATGSARYGIQPTASSHGTDVQARGAGAAESCTAAGAPPCCRAVRCRQLRQWRR